MTAARPVRRVPVSLSGGIGGRSPNKYQFFHMVNVNKGPGWLAERRRANSGANKTPLQAHLPRWHLTLPRHRGMRLRLVRRFSWLIFH